MNVAWESSFGELMIAADHSLEKESVLKVIISTNERFIDPIHKVNITAPVSICDTFKCRFVCMYLRESSDISVSTHTNSVTGVCTLLFLFPCSLFCVPL